MSFIESILLQVNKKTISNHISNYLDLYVKPLTVWKKAISPRKESFTLIVGHLIYYTLIIFLMLVDVRISLLVVLMDVALTLIPFSLLYLPFLAFTNFFNKKLSWKNLFRLLLILKLQFVPIITLIFLIAEKTKIEFLYTIYSNLGDIFFISLFTTLPLILQLKVWQKSVWVFGNLIFACIFLSGFGFLGVLNPKGLSQIAKLQAVTPSSEYNDFFLKYNDPRTYLVDDYYFVLAQAKDSSYYRTRNYFMSYQLLHVFSEANEKEAEYAKYVKDSLTAINNGKNLQKTHIRNFNKLNTSMIDSLKKCEQVLFSSDLKLVLNYKDSSKYESNRIYFNIIYNYLSYIDSLNNVSPLIKNTIDKATLLASCETSDNYLAAVFKSTDPKLFEKQQKVKNTMEEFENRARHDHILMNLLFLDPLEFLLDKVGYFD